MMPLHLEWRRPLDGVEHIPTDEADTGILQARSDRFEPVSYRVHNLEDPLALRLVNCVDLVGLAAFVSRFGFPDHSGFHPQTDRASVALISALQNDLSEILWASTSEDTQERRLGINDLLRFTALHPAFEYSDANEAQSLVLRPSTFADFMVMEAAFAIEAGATMTRCAHCTRTYLTGPLTGRRSHSVYCSDRCRVAAMRVRNAAKRGA